MVSQHHQLGLNTYSEPRVNHILSGHMRASSFWPRSNTLWLLVLFLSLSLPSQPGSCHLVYKLLRCIPSAPTPTAATFTIFFSFISSALHPYHWKPPPSNKRASKIKGGELLLFFFYWSSICQHIAYHPVKFHSFWWPSNIFFIHLSWDRHLGFLHRAIVENTTINIRVHVTLRNCILYT